MPQDTLTIVNRRAVLGGAAVALVAGPAWATPPASGRLRFAVWRSGVRVGQHEMSFVRTGALLNVTSDVGMTLRLGPVPLFRYAHHAVEQWRDDRFERLQTTSSSNGKRERVTAVRSPQGVRIETLAGSTSASARAAPLTHWNPDVLAGPLFNPQTGRLLAVSATRHLAEPLPGGNVGKGTRWALSGDAQIENWYDEAAVWAALRGRLPDGSIMEYRRT